jgi:hypothetical protein
MKEYHVQLLTIKNVEDTIYTKQTNHVYLLCVQDTKD